MRDRFRLSVDDESFTPADREYFKSEDFKRMTPSARNAVFLERYELRNQKSPEELAQRQALEDKQRMEILVERAERERETIARNRANSQARNRLIRGW